jgi:hypothetical protein
VGFPEALIAFVVVGLPTMAIFLLISRLLRHRETKMELEARIAAARGAQDGLLEQRVRVLERIVTDKGVDVSDQIERLRDRPLN